MLSDIDLLFANICFNSALGNRLYTGIGKKACLCWTLPAWTLLKLFQVGWMMARSIVDINWKYAGDALPAFVTLVFMPFSYSIAYGLIASVIHLCAVSQYADATQRHYDLRCLERSDLRHQTDFSWTYTPCRRRPQRILVM